MNFDITQIILAVIGLIIAVISTILIPYLNTKLSKEQLALLSMFANISVRAIEQLYKSESGEFKKLKAIEYLRSKGLRVSMQDVENAIEEAWSKMNAEQIRVGLKKI